MVTNPLVTKLSSLQIGKNCEIVEAQIFRSCHQLKKNSRNLVDEICR